MKPSKNNQQNSISFQQSTIFSGPIPHPEILSQYEKISPGFANRIIAMAEKEQDERIKLNNKIVEYQHIQEINDQKIIRNGYYFSLIAILLIVSLCTYGFYMGFATQTATIASSVIVALAAIFIGKNKWQDTKKAAK